MDKVNNTRWVMCNDGLPLPKKSGNYIITKRVAKHDSKYHYLSDIAHFDTVNGWFCKRRLNPKDVIAWMPIPKLYQAESD